MSHFGDTYDTSRCHLGLDIPEKHPICGIRVGNEEKGWANGKLTLFTEAHLHSTWNHSMKKRYVLVLDIVPNFIEASRLDICSKVLGAQTYNCFEKRITFLKRLPYSSLRIIHIVLTLLWRCYLPVQRRLKFL